MRILGIDPGTGILGFGIVDVDTNGKADLIDAGVIRTPVKQADSDRLFTIYAELNEIIKQVKPTIMAVERLFFSRNVATAMSVAQARGVVLLIGKQQKLELHEYTPQEIKMALTGYGRADKKQMQEMVRIILRLDKVPKPDDCADALAAALTCAQSIRN